MDSACTQLNNMFTENTFENDCLRPIEEIPAPYREIFSQYPRFNALQSRVIDDIFYTDKSVVVSAPTGSGKTAIFELAIVRSLIAYENTKYSQIFKIVYISPLKALCEERLIDWHKKFANFGLKCVSVTGDTDNADLNSLLNHNLIITTPEKWDALTRKWRDNKKLVHVVKLFMIDEVHLLNDENRGPTLEVIVTRMKTIQESITSCNEINENGVDINHRIRFVALSATVPNIEDVAEWMGSRSNMEYHRYLSTAMILTICSSYLISLCLDRFSEEMRPVKIRKIVLGYPSPRGSTPFKFDITLNYKLQNLLIQYSDGKPTLIFCSTRKSVEMTAKHLLQNLTINLSDAQKQKLYDGVSQIPDNKARESIVHGIGYHHAGMVPETRHSIENLFRCGDLPVLVTTSTLAMGVNLPAHLVVIKNTKCYSGGGFKDYSESALLQMIGRAGRPQFDTSATALILTTSADKEKFENMVGGKQSVESNLHRHLTEHLNAEVVLHTITDLDVAMQWLASTFLYIRARKNPRHYGLPIGLTAGQIDKKLLDMCQIELNKLTKAGMLTMDHNILITPTDIGRIMAKYCIAFATMKLFTQISGTEILQQILAVISKCHEFSEMCLRVDDKKCLNLLNKNSTTQESIRFPLSGKIKTLDMKINCIIQAVFGCLDIYNQSILADSFRIMRNGERISRCLVEFLETKQNCYPALLNTIILAKCFHAKLWENSPHVCKQLSGVGNVASSQLVKAGKTSFPIILNSNPRDIELIIKKKAPMGNNIIDDVKYVPFYNMNLERVRHDGQLGVKLRITLENSQTLNKKSTVNTGEFMSLLVGDSANRILLYERYTHAFMIKNPEVIKYIQVQEDVDAIKAHFLSETWVGIDCNETMRLMEKTTDETPQNTYTKQTKKQNKVKTNNNNKKEKTGNTYMQMFMDMYMKCKKNPLQKKAILDVDKRFCENDDAPQRTESIERPKTIVNSQKINIESSIAENKQQQFKNTEVQSKAQGNVNRMYAGSDTVSKYSNEESESKNEETENNYNVDHQLHMKTTSLHKQNSTEGISDGLDYVEIQNLFDIADDFNEEFVDESSECVKSPGFTTNKDNYNYTGEKKSLPVTTNEQTVDINNDKMFEFSDGNGKELDTLLLISQKYKNNDVGKITKVSYQGALKRKFSGEHPAMAFEDSLHRKNCEDENKANFSQFNFTPKKKFAHGAEGKPDSVKYPTLSPWNQQIKHDDMIYKSQKNITWRSPLVHSPKMKFKPKFDCQNISFSNASENEVSQETIETSTSSNMPVARSSKTNTRLSAWSGIKLNTQKAGTKFPISDDDYDTSKSNINLDNSVSPADKISDICSGSFLENFGLKSKENEGKLKNSNQQSQQFASQKVVSATDYYNNIVLQPLILSKSKATAPKKTEEKKEPISGNTSEPFYLNQTHNSQTQGPKNPQNMGPNRHNININSDKDGWQNIDSQQERRHHLDTGFTNEDADTNAESNRWQLQEEEKSFADQRHNITTRSQGPMQIYSQREPEPTNYYASNINNKHFEDYDDESFNNTSSQFASFSQQSFNRRPENYRANWGANNFNSRALVERQSQFVPSKSFCMNSEDHTMSNSFSLHHMDTTNRSDVTNTRYNNQNVNYYRPDNCSASSCQNSGYNNEREHCADNSFYNSDPPSAISRQRFAPPILPARPILGRRNACRCCNTQPLRELNATITSEHFAPQPNNPWCWQSNMTTFQKIGHNNPERHWLNQPNFQNGNNYACPNNFFENYNRSQNNFGNNSRSVLQQNALDLSKKDHKIERQRHEMNQSLTHSSQIVPKANVIRPIPCRYQETNKVHHSQNSLGQNAHKIETIDFNDLDVEDWDDYDFQLDENGYLNNTTNVNQGETREFRRPENFFYSQCQSRPSNSKMYAPPQLSYSTSHNNAWDNPHLSSNNYVVQNDKGFLMRKFFSSFNEDEFDNFEYDLNNTIVNNRSQP